MVRGMSDLPWPSMGIALLSVYFLAGVTQLWKKVSATILAVRPLATCLLTLK